MCCTFSTKKINQGSPFGIGGHMPPGRGNIAAVGYSIPSIQPAISGDIAFITRIVLSSLMVWFWSAPRSRPWHSAEAVRYRPCPASTYISTPSWKGDKSFPPEQKIAIRENHRPAGGSGKAETAITFPEPKYLSCVFPEVPPNQGFGLFRSLGASSNSVASSLGCESWAL